MSTGLDDLVKPGFMRLIDEPIGLEVIERPTGRELEARYPENGVLLSRYHAGDAHYELYLTRSGKVLRFLTTTTALRDGAILIRREFDREFTCPERSQAMGNRTLMEALLNVVDRKIGRAQEKVQVLAFQRHRIERALYSARKSGEDVASS